MTKILQHILLNMLIDFILFIFATWATSDHTHSYFSTTQESLLVVLREINVVLRI